MGEWQDTYLGCTAFWIPYMWYNFTKIAPAGRVQFMAVGNLIWCIFIDHIAHRNTSDGALGSARDAGKGGIEPAVRIRVGVLEKGDGDIDCVSVSESVNVSHNVGSGGRLKAAAESQLNSK